jgi:hypothetical protein
MAFMDYMPQFNNNTASMQETALPADDTAMQMELKRRLKMAEALQQQELPQGQMVSGHYIAPSWTQYLASGINAYQGNKKEREALNQFGEYQKAKQAKLADLLAGKEVTAPVDYSEAGNMPGMMQTSRQPYNQQEFMAKAISAMPELAPQLIQNQMSQYGKEESPISLGEGGVLVNRRGEVIASNPKAQKTEKLFGTVNPSDFTPESLNAYAQSGNYGDLVLIPKAPTGQSNIAKLTAEMNSLPPNDPNRAVYQAAIRKETYIAPREDGQKAPSGYRFNANGTLEAIAGGPADKPLKSAPPTVLHAYQGNNQSLAQLDAAIAAVDKAPEKYFGLQGGLGDTYMQRMYPESTDVRSKYFGVGAAKRHDITGAAMSATEAPELKPFIPSATDTKQAAQAKLQSLRNEILRNNAIIEGMYGDTNTYAPLPNVKSMTQNAPKTIVKTGTDKTTGRKVVQYSDGTTEYVR